MNVGRSALDQGRPRFATQIPEVSQWDMGGGGGDGSVWTDRTRYCAFDFLVTDLLQQYCLACTPTLLLDIVLNEVHREFVVAASSASSFPFFPLHSSQRTVCHIAPLVFGSELIDSYLSLVP